MHADVSPLLVLLGKNIVGLFLFRCHEFPGRGELFGESSNTETGVLLLQLWPLGRAEVEEGTPAQGTQWNIT